MPKHDLTTALGRFRAYWDFWWGDHAFLRIGFRNAHWVGTELVRTNQPWPFQLAQWKRRGIRTVVNLRGGFNGSFYALEKAACQRLGLTLVDFVITSREVPSRDHVAGARRLFESIEYPALIHCKSGADRAGVVAALYRHQRLGEPIAAAARQELTLAKLHLNLGRTGILDYAFDRYLAEGEPQGLTFEQWVLTDAYDPPAMKARYRENAPGWGDLLTEHLLRRE